MKILARGVLPILLLAMAGAGCQFDKGGLTFGRRRVPPPHTLLIHPNNAHKLGYSVQWATDLDLSKVGGISHAALFDDVVIVVAADSNLISAVSLRDGTINWQHSLGESAERLFPPVRSGHRILINSETHLYSLDLERGRLLTISELESVVNTGPAITGDYAVFGGANHRVFAHDATAGYTKWSYELTAPIVAPPVTIGDNVFAADKNGTYALFEGDSGLLLWKGRTFAGVSVPPTTSPLGIFVASKDHSLYALNASTGRDRWIFRYTAPLTVTPHLLGRRLYLSLPDEGLASIDPRTGEQQWRIDQSVDPITLAGDLLLVRKPEVLELLDVENGDLITSVPTDPLLTVLTGDQGRLVLVSQSGRLLRLDPTP